MGLRPPSLRILKERVVLKFHGVFRGEDQYGNHGDIAILPAAVSAPETVPSEIAEQSRAILRCRVIVRSNPTLVDPAGTSRQLDRGDGVQWGGHLWNAEGPMGVEASNSAGVTVAWRFDMRRTA